MEMRDEKPVTSCLTDSPVNSVEEDNLKAEDYANALARFLQNAATPVTVGIQGGWGSGKTSLITVLKQKLDDNPDHPALCVIVNAWEHSLFQAQESRAEVALSLLSAMSEGLSESIRNTKWLDKSATACIEKNNDAIEKAISGLKLGLLFAGKVATQMLSNMVGGGDVSNVKINTTSPINNASSMISAMPRIANNIRALRSTLADMIKSITYRGKPVKVIFFIDDLDRVPPSTAIEILDITKNIFDFPQCVFVLAIDYEVVVKGLENKFGKKTDLNEREFRQYFDKIIQIPFTMPIGAYGDNLSELLEEALSNLGYEIGEDDKETLQKLADNAKLATGGLPRSIKRIINTLSLLLHIRNAKTKGASREDLNRLPPDIIERFIIVALHINFPEICRRLMERSEFVTWTPQDLDSLWNLNYSDYKEELDILAEKDQLFNDPWEQVIYCLTANSPWLKTRASNISRMFNNLLIALGGDFDNATYIPPDDYARLQAILKSISVVSIESNQGGVSNFNIKNIEEHPVTKMLRQVQNIINSKNKKIIPQFSDEVPEIQEDGVFDYSAGSNDNDIPYIEFMWSPEEEELVTYIVGKKPGWKKKDALPILEKSRGDFDLEFEGRDFYYYFNMPFSKEDFNNSVKINSLADETIKLYNTVKKAQAKLAKSNP